MPNVRFKNLRQHQEQTTLPPFALVVFTNTFNQLAKKTICATAPTNRDSLETYHKLPLAVETWKLALVALGKNNLLTLETTNNKCASRPFVRFPR
jgi:hypothetical protein